MHIPKGGSTTETRPLGIPTLEDKLLQRAVVMLLEPIYEQDFLDCSYGFRPGRSAHDALTSFRDQTMTRRPRGGTVLEVDIRKFFDHLDHSYLRQFLRLRVRDGVLLRLIDKWLKAGVMEDGNVSYPDSGSPQGGVITPPTKVQNFLLASSASFPRKKGEVDAIDDPDLSCFDHDASDQRAKYLAFGGPVGVVEIGRTRPVEKSSRHASASRRLSLARESLFANPSVVIRVRLIAFVLVRFADRIPRESSTPSA